MVELEDNDLWIVFNEMFNEDAPDKEIEDEVFGFFQNLIGAENQFFKVKKAKRVQLYQKEPKVDYTGVDCLTEFMELESDQFCVKELACGHTCMGAFHTGDCLGCMEPGCAQAKADKDELCAICYTSELGAEPCTQLECGHIFHVNCVWELLRHKWSTLRISFAFMSCPCCNTEIKSVSVPAMAQEFGGLMQLKEQVETEALKVAQRQGILDDERLKNPEDPYFEKPGEFAMHRCSFYQCNKCKGPFFGGLIDCEQELA